METDFRILKSSPNYLETVLEDITNPLLLEQLRVKEYSQQLALIPGSRNTVIPWSGGLDSTASLLIALESGCTIHTVNFNYGRNIINKRRMQFRILNKKLNNHRHFSPISGQSI